MSSTTVKTALLATTLLTVGLSQHQHADERIVVGIPEVTPYAPGVHVRDAVRKQCQLGEKVSKFLKQYARNRVEFAEASESERYLEMSITEVYALGGGAHTGAKWMEVTGHLTEDGERIASFRAKRYSTGGAFAGFKGTCSIIGRCTKAIGRDIADWLRDPTDGARLGDAR